MSVKNDVIILGGGVCGLAAAMRLGDHATVLEQSDRPGGLVRSERIGEYWFDLVIHLLHFPDERIEKRIRQLLGEVLQPCPPEAWIECAAGIAQFPIQQHLVDLDQAAAERCIRDLKIEIKKAAEGNASPPDNYEEWLLRSFGKSFCEIFFFPYNRKTWKRPLNELAPSGFQWNVARPDLGLVQAGKRKKMSAYNNNGWYPRPEQGADLRGMEILSQGLASQCRDLRLQHKIVSLDLDKRVALVEVDGIEQEFGYNSTAICTLPLPRALELCKQTPADLLAASKKLLYNRVRSVALCIAGPRPKGTGHWRYYTDESLPFTRLVFMHEFDPAMAPEEGWGLLAETTEPAEQPGLCDKELIIQVWAGVKASGVLPVGSELVGANVLLAEVGYVVFTPDMQPIVKAARAFLKDYNVTPMGRYGHWEYSSMAQVITDGFNLADEWLQNTTGETGN
ncbi:MAG: NAD(P)-binding protein [Gammaproteobacteria bacterium]|nr:NAD(P)-binding protein [Gammaproteobacteria bacterium]